MPRRTKKLPEEPKVRELGRSSEERNRHLRYAHEQYSGSGQGPFGAPRGCNLPLEKPQKAEDYPPGTRMPWPRDETIEAEADRPRRRRK
jgi:hypothetical protein